ncbi:MAG: hypothetical protein PHV68_04060 [Candidatus Gastranaerophilales bacterium]|nr:hypothetical protein [Candidatus Gastranaerophilales bacterium]
MDVQKTNVLPEGVGKKIVEALKQQSFDNNQENEYIQEYEEKTSISDNSLEEIPFEQNIKNQSFIKEVQNNSQEFEFENIEESDLDQEDIELIDYSEPTQKNQPQYFQQASTQTDYSFSQPQPQQTLQYSYTQDQNFINAQTETEKYEKKPMPISMPINASFEDNIAVPNVDVLTKLVSQLPPGVTRQTGAQIIRQTIEAMGISMNKVLSEAQIAQEGLGHSVRNNMNKIEEYRNNIRILESQVQNFKAQADKLEDLINLFILSEK